MEPTDFKQIHDANGGDVQRDITVMEAAKRLGVGRTTIYKLMDSGDLPFYRWGSARRIAPAELEKCRQAHRVGGLDLTQ